MTYILIFEALVWLLPVFLLADYWAVKYAVTRRSSPGRLAFVWCVLALGGACLVESDMRDGLTRGRWDSLPYRFLILIPVSVILIPVALMIGRLRGAHMGSGPYSPPPLRIRNDSDQ